MAKAKPKKSKGLLGRAAKKVGKTTKLVKKTVGKAKKAIKSSKKTVKKTVQKKKKTAAELKKGLKKVKRKAKKKLRKKVGKLFTKARKLKNNLSKNKRVKKLKEKMKKTVLKAKKGIKKAKSTAKKVSKAVVKNTKKGHEENDIGRQIVYQKWIQWKRSSLRHCRLYPYRRKRGTRGVRLVSGILPGGKKAAGKVSVPKNTDKAGKKNSVSDIVDDILVDSYKSLRKNKDISGQAHHLNQDAAFRDYIPRNDRLCIKLEGNIRKDVGSPHYKVHESLEGFWGVYRKKMN